MRMYDVIMKKRNGGELSREELRFFVEEIGRASCRERVLCSV